MTCQLAMRQPVMTVSHHRHNVRVHRVNRSAHVRVPLAVRVRRVVKVNQVALQALNSDCGRRRASPFRLLRVVLLAQWAASPFRPLRARVVVQCVAVQPAATAPAHHVRAALQADVLRAVAMAAHVRAALQAAAVLAVVQVVVLEALQAVHLQQVALQAVAVAAVAVLLATAVGVLQHARRSGVAMSRN